MSGTFISYRREDAAGYAGRLRESLQRRLGSERVFRDVDGLRPGQDFVDAIEASLAACRVMLVVIGREWIDARDAAGARRLDEPYDFVRLEVATALTRPEVLVVPVLVEGASMPAASELPENIRPLARRHAVSVRDETWDADVDRVVSIVADAEAGSPGTRPRPRLLVPRVWAPAALVMALLAALAFVLFRRMNHQATVATEPLAQTQSGQAAQSPLAFPAYAIDVPRVAEVAFGHVIYTLVSGNITPRGDTRELRLRVRLSNGGRYTANFWDRTFRLAADGEALAPTSGLDDLVPDHSLRYGIVTFRISPRTTRATLQLFDNPATAPAEIPLDLSPTGRRVVDEQAAVPDSLSQAIVRPALSGAASLLDADGIAVTLDRASTRRFANTLRLRLSIRMANLGKGAVATGSIVMRLEDGDVVAVPLDFPSEVIQATSTTSATVTFDLPTSTTHAVLRTSAGGRSTAAPLELR
jgi:hypothetical protein